MVSMFISRFLILTCGTLYPAYRSYKAVKSKNVREYVKWMMYWIVFALFLCAESLGDIFLAFWFPLYYEMKILFVVWLLSPYTKGASLLYRKFIHPTLVRHEEEIDQYLDRAKRDSYRALVKVGSRSIMYARDVVATAAFKGQAQLVNQLRKSCSLGDVYATSDAQLVFQDVSDGDFAPARRRNDDVDDRPTANYKEQGEEFYDEEDGTQLIDKEFQYLYEASEEEAGAAGVKKRQPPDGGATRTRRATKKATSGAATLPRRASKANKAS
ncbi:unnamed protein product [Soboliphyme baturini]|uniref:Receptor expression-enhancing protein n=1 Tax=Soboliphyme baturini TaxID=241478 RepID=A0A183ID65_9BILA|nr:unnamed protein product [Soboliphyme baturini]